MPLTSVGCLEWPKLGIDYAVVYPHPMESVRSGLVQFHPALTPLLADIDSVSEHPDNPNNGDLEEIVSSIEINGMYRPIYAQDSTGYILAGNGTWLACKLLEAEVVPIIRHDVSDTSR